MPSPAAGGPGPGLPRGPAGRDQERDGDGERTRAALPSALPLGERPVHQPEEVTARVRLEEGLPQAAPRTHTEGQGAKRRDSRSFHQ